MRAATLTRPARTSAAPEQDGWRRASRQEMVAVGVYFFVLVAVTDVLNVRLGVEIMSVAVLVAAVAITRRPLVFLHDWWFVLVGLVAWNLSGPIAAQSPFPAHLDFMLNVDRFLFGGNVPSAVLQAHLAPTAALHPLDWITAAGYNLHVPEPYIVGYLLWRLDRSIYLQFAAAALILLVLGLITFILFPAIPPWMASTRLGVIHGVVNRFGLVLKGHPLPFHGTPIFYLFTFRGDSIAAFPSEHAAFPLLEFLALARCTNRLVTALMAAWVLWVLFTIVYLGEHWVTDALAGYIFALAIWFGVRTFCRLGERHVPLRRLLVGQG